MRRLSIFLVLGLAACEPAGRVSKPPPAYQGDQADIRVAFLSDIDRACRTPAAAPNEILGCELYGKIFVPNPCTQHGAYADLLCHELGHANGWRHD